jgi:8-oxo-dGTP pyrophosphatase MutT (NUDIX family)
MSGKSPKLIKKEILLDGHKRIIKETLEFSPADTRDWIYLDTPASVVVAALTPERELLYIEQYRHNLGMRVSELVAGKVDEGESIVTAAKRELLEETGCKAKRIIELGKYYALPNETNRWVYYCVALDAVCDQPPDPQDSLEKYMDIRINRAPVDEFMQDCALLGMSGIESLYGLQLLRGYLSDPHNMN